MLRQQLIKEPIAKMSASDKGSEVIDVEGDSDAEFEMMNLDDGKEDGTRHSQKDTRSTTSLQSTSNLIKANKQERKNAKAASSVDGQMKMAQTSAEVAEEDEPKKIPKEVSSLTSEPKAVSSEGTSSTDEYSLQQVGPQKFKTYEDVFKESIMCRNLEASVSSEMSPDSASPRPVVSDKKVINLMEGKQEVEDVSLCAHENKSKLDLSEDEGSSYSKQIENPSTSTSGDSSCTIIDIDFGPTDSAKHKTMSKPKPPLEGYQSGQVRHKPREKLSLGGLQSDPTSATNSEVGIKRSMGSKETANLFGGPALSLKNVDHKDSSHTPKSEGSKYPRRLRRDVREKMSDHTSPSIREDILKRCLDPDRFRISRSRERSKSDEGHSMKKYRVSKTGVLLRPGTKLEAMDYSKKWYTAKIVNIDEGDQTVLIHFEGWNSRFDEWLNFDSDRLRPLTRTSARKEAAKEVKALGGYKVGDELLARWSDCRYYPAKILGIKTNGSYRVLFYDGIEKTVMGINVRDMPDSLKSQDFFSNLEHQFRALVNKRKRTSSREAEGKHKADPTLRQVPTGSSVSGSRPTSPAHPAQKRRLALSSQSTAIPQLIKRSHPDHIKVQPQITCKVSKVPVAVAESPPLFPALPTQSRDRSGASDFLSTTSSETSELLTALEQGNSGKKRYREPVIFTKHSGLIRDPRRLVAPKELVIDLDHNKYKCDIPGCSKAFRKSNLLDYHKKYYHIANSAERSSMSALAAAKNAVTRSRKRLSTSAITPGSSKVRRLDINEPGASSKIAIHQKRNSAPGALASPRQARVHTAPPESCPRQPSKLALASGQQDMATAPVTPDDGAITAPASPQGLITGSVLITKVTERSRRVSGTAKMLQSDLLGPTNLKDKATPSTIATTGKGNPPSAVIKKELKSGIIEGGTVDGEPKISDEYKLRIGPADDYDVNAATEVSPSLGKVGPEVKVETADPKRKHSKQHKKHKRHKGRRNERRSREHSRNDRRRAAERAREHRLAAVQVARHLVVEEGKPLAGDIEEWTAKYLPSNGNRNLPQAAGRPSDDPTVAHARPDPAIVQEVVVVVEGDKEEDAAAREMISCVCHNSEEEGFMIQCEACLGWQHGACVGLTEDTVPKQYMCNFCIHPENLRTHARHRFNQDWFQTGKLPCLVLSPIDRTQDESGDLTSSMLTMHQLMADMLNVTEALNGLQHKLEVLKSDNHPDLKMWSYHWGLKDETLDASQQSPLSPDGASLENSTLMGSTRSDATSAGGTPQATDNWPAGRGKIGTRKKTNPERRGTEDEKLENGDDDDERQNIFDTFQPILSTSETSCDGDTTNAATPPPETRHPASRYETGTKGTTALTFVPDNDDDSSSPICLKPGAHAGADDNEPSGIIIPDNLAVVKVSDTAKTGVSPGEPTTMEDCGKAGDGTEAVESGDAKDSREAVRCSGDVSGHSGDSEDQPGSAMDPSMNEAEHSQCGPKNSTIRGEENAAKDSGKVNEYSSDDEPLVKYVKKSASGSLMTAKPRTPPPIDTAQSDTAIAAADASSEVSPSSCCQPASSCGQAVSINVCKMHLWNHIVCVEDELSRRMDVVQEKIQALELSHSQSVPVDTKYVSPETSQLTRAIHALMEDLNKVCKLATV